MKIISLDEIRDFGDSIVAINVKVDGFSLCVERVGNRLNFFKRGGKRPLTFIDRITMGQYERPIDHVLSSDWKSLPESVKFFLECFNGSLYMSYATSNSGDIFTPDSEVVQMASLSLNVFDPPVVYRGTARDFVNPNHSQINDEIINPLEGYVIYVTTNGRVTMFRNLTNEFVQRFKKAYRCTDHLKSLIDSLDFDHAPTEFFDLCRFIHDRVKSDTIKSEVIIPPASYFPKDMDSELFSAIVSIMRKTHKEPTNCAIFPGRFQPFHDGHRKSAEELDMLTVFVAIRGKNPTNHLFSPEQTAQMIINGCGKSPALVIRSNDAYIPRIVDEVWNRFGLETTHVISGSDRDYSKMAKNLTFVRRDRIASSREIVKAASSGLNWENLVDPSNVGIVRSMVK